jgi:uncharacterized protein YdeI (YjbR/CyaY-like superfamily)
MIKNGKNYSKSVQTRVQNCQELVKKGRKGKKWLSKLVKIVKNW